MVKKFGTRSEVYDELAERTRGGLTKTDLIVSRTGKIVSKKKSEMARKSYQEFGFKKRLEPEAPAKKPRPRTRRTRRKATIVEEQTNESN
jgi:hypothetical protein